MGGIPYEKRLHIVRDFRTRMPPTGRRDNASLEQTTNGQILMFGDLS